jgi:hypothetical protein
MKTFRTSYCQIHHDFDWHPSVVGAFGYGTIPPEQIAYLAERSRVPGDSEGLYVILIK